MLDNLLSEGRVCKQQGGLTFYSRLNGTALKGHIKINYIVIINQVWPNEIWRRLYITKLQNK